MRYTPPAGSQTRCGENIAFHVLNTAVSFVHGDKPSGIARYGPWYNVGHHETPVAYTLVTEAERTHAAQWLEWQGFDHNDQQAIEDIGLIFIDSSRKLVHKLHGDYMKAHPVEPLPEPPPEPPKPEPPKPEPPPEPKPEPPKPPKIDPPPADALETLRACRDWFSPIHRPKQRARYNDAMNQLEEWLKGIGFGL